VAYTELTIQALRHKLFDEALAEFRAAAGDANASPTNVSLSLIEQRAQTYIMAGIGDSKSATTSPEVASIAAQYMSHEDPNVRKLAASALTQREPE
jgi:hypothetical protein